MDDKIIVAIIGFFATVIAAVIGKVAWFKRTGSHSQDSPEKASRTYSINSGRDVIYSEGDAVIHQHQSHYDTFFGPEGISLIEKASKQILPDPIQQMKWSSFDSQFLAAGIAESVRGPTFDFSKVKSFQEKRYENELKLSAKIYAHAAKWAEESSSIPATTAKRLDATMQIYGALFMQVSNNENAAHKLDEGVYMDLDDDRVIQKAKELKAYRALDVYGTKGGVAVVCKEVDGPNGIDLHVFVNLTDQIGDDNGYIHLLAERVDAHPERKNKIWRALKEEYGLDPNNAIPLN